MDTPSVLGPCGRLELILGPMFSGKSTELQRRIRRHQAAKRRCLVIKYKRDTRYTREECICTHDQATMSAFSCDTLADAARFVSEYDTIGIDEGQFFPDIVEFADRLADAGKIVIVAALDGTFQRRPFNDILALIPRAENVVKLSAICQICNSDAAFSRRLTADQEVELIGGADKYIAVCRNCYHKTIHNTTTAAENEKISPTPPPLSPPLSPVSLEASSPPR
ncbi:putative Thymidine kinase; cytosolic [Paratrimastix pyriformis]|uniref:Thymidine kinase n=1 Tax=Paratrimastix pyriformis TaxID=342808 RepID=A0ABQ8UE18_9EUKA|nr:putative Thymidine kinase; cytosolic [Paratrimastix pyriformis]